jgi:tRNA threonylcarbamoyladenosine biosynthesis protein TsaE
MDLYRLPSSCDLNILGIPQIFTDSLCIIEWPQRMKHEDLPDDYVTVNIAINEDQSRSVRFTASSARWTKKIKDLMDDIIKDMQ